MKQTDLRIAALSRFAIAITVLNLLGHTVLGFESSWAQMAVTVVSAYLFELFLEWLDARAGARRPRYAGGLKAAVNFLLPAHITGLAISMLLYCNDLLYPFVFAAGVAICSKAILTAPVGNSQRHVLNPSNAGIAITVLVFPWTAVTLPYQFTENLTGPLDWALPALIVITGSFLNARFTKRILLGVSWITAFFLQAVARSFIFDVPVRPMLAPMVGVAFVLFTFYMVTDPGTTPSRPRNQILFGTGVGFAYGFLLVLHFTYAMFIALLIVCTLRAVILYGAWMLNRASVSRLDLAAPAVAAHAAPAAVANQTELVFALGAQATASATTITEPSE